MNKIFKTILNKNTNQSTVASELAKGHGRVKNTCKAIALSIALAFGLSSPSFAEGNAQLDMMVGLLSSVDGDAAKLVQKLGDYMGNSTYKLPNNINALLTEGDELINDQLTSYFTGGRMDLTAYKAKLNEIITAIEKENPNSSPASTGGDSNNTATNTTTANTQPSANTSPSQPSGNTASNDSNPVTALLKKMNDEMNNGGLTEGTRAEAQDLLMKLSQNQATADQLIINNSKYKTVAKGAGAVSVAGAYTLNDPEVSYDKSSNDPMANGQAEFSNLAVGPNAMATKNGQVSVGIAANAYGAEVLDTGFRSISLGYYANAVDTDSVAVGANTWGLGNNSTAVGAKSKTYGNGATAIGSNSLAYTNGSLAMGYGAVAGVNQLAEEQKELNKLYSGVDENGNKVEGSLFSVVAKHDNLTEEQKTKINSLGFGESQYNLEILSAIDVATDFADFPDDIKDVLTKLKETSLKVMDKKQAISKSIAIGYETASYGDKSVAVGNGNKVGGNLSNVFGDSNTVAGATSSVLGNANNIDANASGIIVAGNKNTVSGDAQNTVVLGHNITTGLKNSVILGNASNGSTSATQVNPLTFNGKTYNFAGVASEANGVVSVGSANAERQIKHVAPGEISETSTDAVNGSQLHALFDSLQNAFTTVNDLKTKTETNTADIETLKNAKPVVAPAQPQPVATPVELPKNLDVETVKASTSVQVGKDGAQHVKLTEKGLTVANGISIEKGKITNLDKGMVSENSKEAVNGAQLHETNIRVNAVEARVSNIDNQIGRMNGRIGSLEKQVSKNKEEARSGIAGSAAIAGLPEIHMNGKSMVSVAGSNFKNQNAIAVGYTKLNDKGNLKFKLSGAATTNNDFITTIGLGYAW